MFEIKIDRVIKCDHLSGVSQKSNKSYDFHTVLCEIQNEVIKFTSKVPLKVNSSPVVMAKITATFDLSPRIEIVSEEK